MRVRFIRVSYIRGDMQPALEGQSLDIRSRGLRTLGFLAGGKGVGRLELACASENLVARFNRSLKYMHKHSTTTTASAQARITTTGMKIASVPIPVSVEVVVVLALLGGVVMLGDVVAVQVSPELQEQSSVQILSHKGPVKSGKQISLKLRSICEVLNTPEIICLCFPVALAEVETEITNRSIRSSSVCESVPVASLSISSISS